MAKNIENIRIYGDDTSGVWVAAKGTTGPTDLTAPPVGFVELGWLSEDGVDESVSQDATTYRAWQGAQIVRRKITSADVTFKIQCLEENATTFGLRYRGQSVTTATAVASVTVKNQTVQDDRAWVIDMVDGEVTKRYVIPSGAYEMTGTIPHRNGGISMLEFTITPQGDYSVYSNSGSLVG